MLALMSSCIIYHNPSSAVTLLDIPRSIEQAQGALSSRLISSTPLECEYPAVEPKSDKARDNFRRATLDELLLQRHLELALDEVNLGLKSNGTWCLPRITGHEISQSTSERKKIRVNQVSSPDLSPNRSDGYSATPMEQGADNEPIHLADTDTIQYHNPHSKSMNITVGDSHARIPPKSTILQGNIAATLNIFTSTAPRFNFIVLDPPWPNRSARRKRAYDISYGTNEVKNLLSLLPIRSQLTDLGWVAVWVTNKSSFREMLLREEGVFEQWGLRFVEEWIWLKVTSGGQPICPLDSKWRKPYEVVLVGKKIGKGEQNGKSRQVNRRVILGVPDLHSRKPNLRCIIEQVIGKGEGGYEALEVFARNLTAGWWCWGKEVLKFQMSEHWK